MEGLVPAVVQNVDTGDVLMLGYMNRDALKKTCASKRVWFYSRSKKRLWMKGEKSGNVLKLVDIKVDCDGDALLVRARPTGPVCHTGEPNCFKDSAKSREFERLFATIVDRRKKLPKGSYTASLFKAGLDRIALKVSEESLEVIQAATKETRTRLVEESVDLLYHLFVLLVSKDVNFVSLEKEISKRARK